MFQTNIQVYNISVKLPYRVHVWCYITLVYTRFARQRLAAFTIRSPAMITNCLLLSVNLNYVMITRYLHYVMIIPHRQSQATNHGTRTFSKVKPLKCSSAENYRLRDNNTGTVSSAVTLFVCLFVYLFQSFNHVYIYTLEMKYIHKIEDSGQATYTHCLLPQEWGLAITGK